MACSRMIAEHIHYCRSRFRLAFGLQMMQIWLARWMVVAGIAILLLKTTGFYLYFSPFWVLFSGMPVFLLLIYSVYKTSYSNEEIAAWLDLKNHGGGVVISLADDTENRDAVRLNTVAAISLRPLWRQLRLPLVFLLASFCISGVIPESTVSTAAVKQQQRQVAVNIEKAKTAEIIPQNAAVTLEQQLDRALNAAQRTPEAAAEAIARVQQSLDQTILQQAEKSQHGLQAAMQFAEAETRNETDPAQVEDKLADALNSLPDFPQLPPELQKELEKLMQETGCSSTAELGKKAGACMNKLSPEALQKLAEMMAKAQCERLSACENGKLCMGNAEMMRQLEDMLKEGGTAAALNEEAMAALAVAANTTLPGQGGISRGRGDAELKFGKESTADGVKFKADTLTKPNSSFFPGPRMGQTKIRADQPPPPEFQPAGRSKIELGKTSGGDAAETRLSPHHREVAVRYFSEESK